MYLLLLAGSILWLFVLPVPSLDGLDIALGIGPLIYYEAGAIGGNYLRFVN